ncbi:long-chain fatty acid--CoA ligase [Pikeienuella piscinae]|uniref:3-methylmercaptopropionyl-CoA ligase n=1 Tax=Pikeienuella piscinae TaxID=2748098 RepID=A0A7L5BWW3_9RHOB|nr:AMP-binding protein [Pikeienuella piscinae]QIE55027.1 long-chain fatty acid--CoA ligase [Pikeienuella piscinae]
MNPAEWIMRAARVTPDAPALFRGEALVADYAGFARATAGVAAGLRGAHGLERGERVAIFMTNRTEYLEALYGVWHAGLVAVPINAKLHPKEAGFILRDSDAKLVLASEDVGTPLAALGLADIEIVMVGTPFDRLKAAAPMPAPASIGADDLIWLFYTSGTTGRPKGVMLSAGNLAAMAFGYLADVSPVERRDATLYAAPMSHGAGLYSLMFAIAGARHVCPESGGFEPTEIAGLAPKIGRVSMFAAPTMIHRLVAHMRKTGGTGEGIDTIVYGGGPMHLADIVDAVEVMGDRFVQIYGQGECPMAISVLPREIVSDRAHAEWRARAGSVGYAQAVSRIRIVGPDGRVLPTGEIGEIEVAGPAVMKGYWRNEKATRETLVDGWLRTGDMGALDESGMLALHDRSKDVIISGGANIYPREVEEALLHHSDVDEVAVVGRPHPDWGEEVVACVVTVEGRALDEAALDAHCRGMIARFKRPKAYLALPRLPKNNYGKVVKTELRALVADAGARSG